MRLICQRLQHLQISQYFSLNHSFYNKHIRLAPLFVVQTRPVLTFHCILLDIDPFLFLTFPLVHIYWFSWSDHSWIRHYMLQIVTNNFKVSPVASGNQDWYILIVFIYYAATFVYVDLKELNLHYHEYIIFLKRVPLWYAIWAKKKLHFCLLWQNG